MVKICDGKNFQSQEKMPTVGGINPNVKYRKPDPGEQGDVKFDG